MKHTRYIFVLVCSFLMFRSVTTVSAHASGPPYVKLNGIYAQTNPLQTYAVPVAMTIGSDVATASAYIVNQKISFEVDEQFFPNPYGYGADTAAPAFRWNFGDGSEKIEGKNVSHTYTKSGTYVIDLEVKYVGKVNEYSSVNTIQLNILPYNGYVLPKANIAVNNKNISDPTKDIIEIRGNREVKFDGSTSTGDIVSYTWDFSDEQKGKGKTTQHIYKHSDYFPMFPVLRVTDRNNISSDTFVFLDAPQSNNVIMNIIGWFQDIFITVKSALIKQ